MGAMPVFVSTDGLEMTVARILTIASMRPASTEPLALTELEALAVAARLERLDYCAIWMTPALLILVTLMPYARLVQSMDLLLALALKDIKDPTARKTSTSVSKVC